MIFYQFAENFRNEALKFPMFSRFSDFRYHFSRFFQVIRDCHVTNYVPRNDKWRRIASQKALAMTEN